MLMCNVVKGPNGFQKLVIQPEITDGGEEIEIALTEEQADEILALEEISYERE